MHSEHSVSEASFKTLRHTEQFLTLDIMQQASTFDSRAVRSSAAALRATAAALLAAILLTVPGDNIALFWIGDIGDAKAALASDGGTMVGDVMAAADATDSSDDTTTGSSFEAAFAAKYLAFLRRYLLTTCFFW